MVFIILGIPIIVAIYFVIVTPDHYSNWGEEYMDEEFKKHKSK